MKRWLILIALTICLGASVITALYLIENQQAAKEWRETQAKLAAEGVSFSPEAFLPPPVPDEQNLAMAPYYQRALAYEKDPKTGRLLSGPLNKRDDGLGKLAPILKNAPRELLEPSWPVGGVTDLSAQSAFADEFLNAAEPALSELEAAAAARPLIRFPVYYDADYSSWSGYSHAPLLSNQLKALSLRAHIEISRRDGEAALRDLTLATRLTHSLEREPGMGIQRMGLKQDDRLAQAIYDGLVAQCWSDEALVQLQALAGSLEPLRAWRRAMDFELAAQPATIDAGKAFFTVAEFKRFLGDKDQRRSWEHWSTWLAPMGSFERAKVYLTLNLSRWEKGKFGANNRWIHAAAPKLPPVAISGRIAFPESEVQMLARDVMWREDDLEKGVTNAARIQAALKQASLACSLERRRRKEGAYPATLDTEATDPIEGGALRYLRNADGKGYVLYSIGPNGRDDGGALPSRDKEGHIDDSKSDWVWAMPPKALPAASSSKP